MSQQSIYGSGPAEDSGDLEQSAGSGQVSASVQGADDILEEIDLVLEENSEAFVRSFVQKGGQ
ncbi:ubiquitin-like protein Pup [Brachybacterium sp. JHP9]|uniref:Prokaryotic ubiquitin-like protein Pup n=1 Tax=Brachybacterium equifaecis TaxID=2910770 RepID=A0ABT0R2I2_9MICO|nr:ubiquitin-like protein Pup [Brachybacterium equifaecis]MCL6424106.1 ubiquitin-like protein Pup [Brachybacterium equifaecis]